MLTKPLFIYVFLYTSPIKPEPRLLGESSATATHLFTLQPQVNRGIFVSTKFDFLCALFQWWWQVMFKLQNEVRGNFICFYETAWLEYCFSRMATWQVVFFKCAVWIKLTLHCRVGHVSSKKTVLILYSAKKGNLQKKRVMVTNWFPSILPFKGISSDC